MPKRTDINSILIIGAGPIIIGQACEFDYSGTQGIKALKEEGYRVILINSNPATIMTDHNLADSVYIEPITVDFIKKIIAKERPDVILPTLGGQTALNAALKLIEYDANGRPIMQNGKYLCKIPAKTGLDDYYIGLIGANIDAINTAEDRGLFKKAMEEIGLKCPASFICTDLNFAVMHLFYSICKDFLNIGVDGEFVVSHDNIGISEECSQIIYKFCEYYGLISHNLDIHAVLDLLQKSEKFQSDFVSATRAAMQKEQSGESLAIFTLPAIIRPSLTLGGTGGGVANTFEEYVEIVQRGLDASPICQVQIDQSLIGWKEYEMEVIRDKNDNSIIVCSIENIDPMGVHTGDSITVAPAMTLTDKEYQVMRDASLAVLRKVGVETGGSNVQFAVNPANGDMVVIEMNPRVSRSSALASKATGFPIAKVAAKLAIGYTLDELRNDIACGIPKEFDYLKFKTHLERIETKLHAECGGDLQKLLSQNRAFSEKIEDYIYNALSDGVSFFQLHQRVLPASFEPTIDYVVVKIPKFNFEKFGIKNPELGTQMQSVGEVMAIGRNFEESFLKAVWSLEEPWNDLHNITLEECKKQLSLRIPNKFYHIFRAFGFGISVNEIIEITGYDRWFLERFQRIDQKVDEIMKHGSAILDSTKVASNYSEVSKKLVFEAKQLGLRDLFVRQFLGFPAGETGKHPLREWRKSQNIKPVFKRIDTCANEFATNTNYFYSTYENGHYNLDGSFVPAANEASALDGKKVIVIGSGPNRIGQGIEFDYACVHGCLALREIGIKSIMINCNPETVSTDYDTSDRLYFEPLTDEHVMNVIENELEAGELLGVIVQFGGQTPLKLRNTLHAAGIPILGMQTDAINICDDRERFGELCNKLGVHRPQSAYAHNFDELMRYAKDFDYKFIIRPSAVIGGRGMAIIQDQDEFSEYCNKEKLSSIATINHLLDKFLIGATELDVDAIRDKEGNVFVCGILEHIEYAGIHSGDSACSLPCRTVSTELQSKVSEITVKFANELNVIGLINIQFAIQNGEIYVIEVNPRASRTVPFTSKALKLPIPKIATKVMCGMLLAKIPEFTSCLYKKIFGNHYVLDVNKIDFWAVKEAVFSFEKFLSSDVVLGPEMKSTGEVMGIGKTFNEAYAKALLATGQNVFKENGFVFLSVKDDDKNHVTVAIANQLITSGIALCATSGTRSFLMGHGVSCDLVYKVGESDKTIINLINEGKIRFVINTTSGLKSLKDSMSIRRAVIANKILYSTNIESATLISGILHNLNRGNVGIF